MPNPMPQEEEKHDSDNEYDPMSGRLTPYMNQGGIVDDQTPNMFTGGVMDEGEDDQSGVPDVPAMVPPPRPLPGMPPSVTPDVVQQTLIQKPPQAPPAYGADQQLAMEQELTKRRSGFIPTIANAGAGFADALMQGVARAGPGNFQANLQNRLDKNDESIRSGFKDYRTGKVGEQKLAMENAEKDPASHISRMAQKSAGPLLKSMGMLDEEIMNVPASLIAQAQTNQLSLEEIRAKAEETRALREQTGVYQQGMLENTRRGQAQTSEQAKATQKAAAKKSQMDAATEVLKRSGNARAFGIPIPFTSDVSGKDQKAAMGVLKQGMSGGSDFQTEEEAEAAGLPPGTSVTIAGRRAVIQ